MGQRSQISSKKWSTAKHIPDKTRLPELDRTMNLYTWRPAPFLHTEVDTKTKQYNNHKTDPETQTQYFVTIINQRNNYVINKLCLKSLLKTTLSKWCGPDHFGCPPLPVWAISSFTGVGSNCNQWYECLCVRVCANHVCWVRQWSQTWGRSVQFMCGRTTTVTHYH